MKTKTHTNEDGSTVTIPDTVRIVNPHRVHIGPYAYFHEGSTAVLYGGNFYRGVFNNGRFHGGTFQGGHFSGGIFNYGVFNAGRFYGGVFNGGEFNGGGFCGGEFNGGEFHDGEFHGGTFYDGSVIRTPRDFLTAGPVGVEPSLLTVARTETGWQIVGGCSAAVPFDLEADDDPFLDDYPAKGIAMSERAAAIAYLRTVCLLRGEPS